MSTKSPTRHRPITMTSRAIPLADGVAPDLERQHEQDSLGCAVSPAIVYAGGPVPQLARLVLEVPVPVPFEERIHEQLAVAVAAKQRRPDSGASVAQVPR